MIGNEYQQPYQAVSGSGNNQGFDMAQGQLVINNDGMIDEAPPSKDEMMAIFSLCRNNHWNSCLQCLRTNPEIGVTTMTMVR